MGGASIDWSLTSILKTCFCWSSQNVKRHPKSNAIGMSLIPHSTWPQGEVKSTPRGRRMDDHGSHPV